MIFRMKKVQILLPAAERESFLKKLAKVGVVHIEEQQQGMLSNSLEETGSKIKRYRSVYDALQNLSKESDAAESSAPSSMESEDIIEQFEKLEQQREAANQKISGFKKDVLTLKSWGDFDPDLIIKLKKAGIGIRFFEASEKIFSGLDLTDCVYSIIEKGPLVRFVVFERGEPSDIGADEVSLPLKSISAVAEEGKELERQIDTLNRQINGLIPEREKLRYTIEQLELEESFERARLSLEEGAEGSILLLTGWFPSEREKAVADFLSARTAWFEIRTPRLDEEPPVKLKNSRFSKHFEVITKMFSLPDYFELDPTPFFAPFFMFFYGMSLGDLGYGLLLLAAAIILISKGPERFKSVFVLGAFMGAMTMINGIFLNSFFGAAIFNVEGVSGLVEYRSFMPFLGSRVIDGKTEFPAMTFAIYLGLVQMLLGMALQVANRIRRQGLIYAVQPMCYIPLTLAAVIYLARVDFLNMGTYSVNNIEIGRMIAGIPFSVMIAIGIIGVVPFIFLNSPNKSFYKRPLKFLWEFYNYLNGIVANGLSYLRLFALGLAGALLGKAFNDIALMLIQNEHGEISFASPLIVFTVLIMIAGHLLNFGLAALGAYVHSVRLIFVEFYNNLNFKGGGKSYTPFAENVTKNN